MNKAYKRQNGGQVSTGSAKWRKRLIFGLILIPWLCVLSWFLPSRGLFGMLSAVRPERANSFALKPGPWGNLRAIHFELKAPEKVTLDLCRTNLPAWFFGSITTKEQLGAFFKEAGCTPEQTAELLGAGRPGTNGWIINPGLDVRLALSKEARAKINFYLADFPENVDQHYARRWPRSEFSQWLDGADLSPETKHWFERLAYSDGGYFYFASEPTVTRLAADDAERIRVCEALLLTKSMIVTLHVEPDSDVEALVKYWGAGGRERDVRPILEGLARIPGGDDVDIVNLLPPAAETLLYTYPRLDEPYTDCHWAAFNFFNPAPVRKPFG